jgi:hypothetical protein
LKIADQGAAGIPAAPFGHPESPVATVEAEET